MRACSFCNAPTDGLVREYTQWEQRRKMKGAGAVKSFARRYTGRVACESCAYDLRNGLNPGTPKLFKP